MKDFFISYNGGDRTWAEWIAWELEAAGYSTVIQAWDFRPGENFVLEMHRATVDAECTIIVLSQNYLQAEYTHPEWAAAFAADPQGDRRGLIPVRIDECEVEGLLRSIIRIDLAGIDEEDAAAILLEGVAREQRAKPSSAPEFPVASATGKPRFPGYPGLDEKINYLENCRTDLRQESRVRLLWVLGLVLAGLVFTTASIFVLPAAVMLPVSLGGGGLLSTLSGFPLKDLSPLKRRLHAYGYLVDGYSSLKVAPERDPERKRELDRHFDRLIETELGAAS